MISKTLTCNYLINIGAISWVISQLLKTVIFFFQNKKMNFKRLSESGGMPSAHSALVCSVALGTVHKYGLSSPYFSFALTLAMIVMYDAMGVRRAAGEQAKAINNIQEYLSINECSLPIKENSKIEFNKLNESLGHTLIEVIAGSVLGICVTVVSIVWFHWA